MKKTLTAVLLSLTLAAPVMAKDIAGVKYPDTATVAGKELKLNGVGLRKKAIFKVYTVGLYVETPTQDATALLNADEVKRVRMFMKRDLKKDQITEAIENGFKKNAGANLPKLQDRLNAFKNAIPAEVKEGQELILTYVPGKGTTVQTSDGKSIEVEGKDFADALFSVWLGKDPVDSGLKDGMLGKDD
ncbi:chalcone isomerase family protein [Corallococcus exercitus]|uniref:Chalcone isomerase family protein n=1 Tax=Corallococcus exercitus TaxID=2316736 RepID=A0A7Y4JUM5_9BACT|nr:chalcone isomerase family protein [Corallococcus exercitus]NOK10522.1 chalcone isomerase family protein [Corallococcus exercitus]